MSKYVKNLLQAELERKFSDVDNFVVVETKGLSGNENNEMRGELRDKDIRLSVVRNAMMRRAMENLDKPNGIGLFEAGPCTVAYGGDSVVDVAKALEDWTKKYDFVNFKGAYVDGEALSSEDAKALAKMPNRAELQGEIVQIAQTPGSNIAGAVTGPAQHLAGCIKSLIEKLEEAA
ncbi:Vegetative protein 300 [Anaerohalosphaera lusitana]|uniref:Large ribosomal subunit protein uL10 n=1 Tax=Anaerohalosphaera lusitana TaxID=1936003 RepID=A0A1U9NPL3_9BACT|nr:50S ribosomal protein L10 [Anaerohalosphaera lusitana]AQT69861.1 Vegetative protein 300 [Anaerohalosphaera lusitana]